MTEDELQAIEERRAAAVEHLKPYEGVVFSATNENAVTITLSRSSADVDALVAEVRRQAAELQAWREWVNDMFDARIDPDDPDTPNTDESLRSLASAIINE
jgi:hypothetical protein